MNNSLADVCSPRKWKQHCGAARWTRQSQETTALLLSLLCFFFLVYIWMRSVSAGGRLCKAKLGKQSRGPQQAQTTKKHWHTRFYSEFLSAPGWALSFTMSQGSNTFSLFNQAIFIKHFTSSSAHSRLVSHSCLWRRRLRLGNKITLLCVCVRARARVEAYWHLDLD